MILLAETSVKYRDGTVKSLDELGGEAKELAPNTPVVSGSTSKPLDEFIQDQIVLSPDTVVVDGEDTTTLEDFIGEEIDGNDGVVHKTGTESITGTKTFREEIRVETPGSLLSPLTKYESDAIESNAQNFVFTGQDKFTLDSDLEVTGDISFADGGGWKWSVFKTGTTHSYDSISMSDLKNKYTEILVIPCTSTSTTYSLPFVIPVNEISWNDEYIFYGSRNPDIGIRISGSAATHPNTFYVFVDDLNGDAVNTSYTVYAR